MLVIQLPYLQEVTKEQYKESEYSLHLYQLLQLFNQKETYKDNKHRLRLLKKIFPKSLKRIIDRLKSVEGSNPDLEDEMMMEDLCINELQRKRNQVAYLQETILKNKKQL